MSSQQCSELNVVHKTITQLFGTPGVCKLGLIDAGCLDGTASGLRSHWITQFNIPEVMIVIIYIIKTCMQSKC